MTSTLSSTIDARLAPGATCDERQRRASPAPGGGDMNREPSAAPRPPLRAPIADSASRGDAGGTRWLGISIVAAVHLAVLYFILQGEPARQTLRTVAPLMVELIAPPKAIVPPPPAPPPPRPPPKPRLEPLKTTAPPPPLVTPLPRPLAEFVPPTTTAPAPATPIAETAPVAPPVAPSPSAPTAPVAAPAITPPSFAAAYLRNRPPAYPAASRRLSEEGRVVLRVLVDTNGDPEKIEIATSSGFQRLDEAALSAVRTWKFVPAQQAGRTVAAWVQVPLVFSLTR